MDGILRFIAVLMIIVGMRTFVTTRHFIGPTVPTFQFYELPMTMRIFGLSMLIGGLTIGLLIGKPRE